MPLFHKKDHSQEQTAAQTLGQPLAGGQTYAVNSNTHAGIQQPLMGQQNVMVQQSLAGQPLMGQQNMMAGQPILAQQSHMGQQTTMTQQPLMGQQNIMTQQTLAGQTGFTGAPMGVQTGAPILQKSLSGNMQQQNTAFMGQTQQHETIVMPAIIQETVRTDRIVEVQPVIHREVDQSIIHHIEKHITEAPAANRGGVVEMAPIVQETVRPHIIDEVTPVIHREVAQTVVERVEEHRGEHIVAPTQHTKETVFENSGMASGVHLQQGINSGVHSQQGGLGNDFNLQKGLMGSQPGLNAGLAGSQPGHMGNQTGLNAGLPAQQGLLGKVEQSLGLQGQQGQQGLYAQPGMNTGLNAQQGMNTNLHAQQGLNTQQGLLGKAEQALLHNQGAQAGVHTQPQAAGAPLARPL